MPQYTYFLDPENQKKLTITRKFTWKDLNVFYNDELIGTVEKKEQLLEGTTFTLPDQSMLSLTLKPGFADELEVLLDGKTLPGSATDSNQKVKNAWQLTLFLGLLNIVLGLLDWLFDIQLLSSFGHGLISLLLAPVYLALAFGIRRFSLVALYGVMATLALDIILTLYIKYTGASDTGFGTGFILKGYFIYLLTKAIVPINQLKQQRP